MPTDPLHILVVDAQPTIALPVIDAVRELGHRAEAQNNGGNAVHAITLKQRANRPYHLVLVSVNLADLDPVGFLHALRQHHHTVPVYFYAQAHALPRELFTAIEHLGGRFVSLPLDRRRLESLINDVTRGGHHPSDSAGESPFFGTGRIARRPATVAITVPEPALPRVPDLPPAHSLPPLPEELQAPTVLRGTAQFENQKARYIRTPLPGAAGVPVAVPRQSSPSTERQRRSVETQQRPPEVGSSTRIRRSITGKVVNPLLTAKPTSASPTHQARITTCAACHKTFYAELRPSAYALPCLHCGHLNRIDPA